MPKTIDKKGLRNLILLQTEPFDRDAISAAAQVSPSAAYTMIQELLAQQHIVLDHKDGKRMFFAVAKNASGIVTPVKGQSILTLTPAQRFSYVADCVDMVLSGISPSLLVTGVSGIGKTYLVRERFKAAGQKEGMDFHFVQGHSSPMGLYRFLYEHRDSTVVFDDCDSVFKDSIAINLLKSALDSYDVRKVSWVSERMPDDLESSFEFEGQIIFISNLDACRVDEAVKSRTMVIDLQLSRKEICEYLWTLLPLIETKMDKGEKEEVLRYLDDKRDCFEQFNIRTFIKACRIRKAADMKGSDWKKMIMVII